LHVDTVGDSVNKGALRLFGTFAAGSVALLLAALFPQDRWGYLLCATLYLALCTYMTGHSSRWYFWFIGGYVMPHLHDFVGFGTGIFVAIFLICFVLSKPEQVMARGIGTSFFVMVISVNNQQSYDFLYVVNFGLMTQLIMGALWITSWFPISFWPQDAIFKQMRRFFTGCERIASAVHGDVQTPSPADAARLPS